MRNAQEAPWKHLAEVVLACIMLTTSELPSQAEEIVYAQELNVEPRVNSFLLSFGIITWDAKEGSNDEDNFLPPLKKQLLNFSPVKAHL